MQRRDKLNFLISHVKPVIVKLKPKSKMLDSNVDLFMILKPQLGYIRRINSSAI